jgi:hypothetical protein
MRGGKAGGKGGASTAGKDNSCFNCGGAHWIAECPKPRTDNKGGGGGKAGGKQPKGGKGGGKSKNDGGGKAKGGGKGGKPPGGKPEKVPLTDEEKKKLPCAYAQTKWHGGKGCNNNLCPFNHNQVATQEEYDKLYKPWGRYTPRGSDKFGGAAKPSTPVGTPRIFAMKADYNLFCKAYLKCPGQASPDGDGSCNKVHASSSETKLKIKNDKQSRA